MKRWLLITVLLAGMLPCVNASAAWRRGFYVNNGLYTNARVAPARPYYYGGYTNYYRPYYGGYTNYGWYPNTYYNPRAGMNYYSRPTVGWYW